jgi:hypothetical protein
MPTMKSVPTAARGTVQVTDSSNVNQVAKYAAVGNR